LIVRAKVLNNRFQKDVDPSWLLFESPYLKWRRTSVVAQGEFLARARSQAVTRWQLALDPLELRIRFMAADIDSGHKMKSNQAAPRLRCEAAAVTR